jgi:hypothetical protein
VHCIPSAVRPLLHSFESCFTAPGFRHFVRLVTGWILLRGCHTISRVFQASCALASGRHHAAFYRFLSEGRWSLDAVGHVVFRSLRPWLPERLLVLVDDTLCAKCGPQIFGVGVHLDATQSNYAGPGRRYDAFCFGHNWVVLAVWVPCPWRPETGWAVPILFRLLRAKKSTAAGVYRKRSELAAEMIAQVASWRDPAQPLYVVGDGAYCCKTVLQALPPEVFFVGPLRLDAALYELPRGATARGRPRQKGYRIAGPRQRLANEDLWKEIEVGLYAGSVPLEIWTEVCLWYPSAGARAVRVVGTRDPKGRLEPRAFICTDPSLDACALLTVYGFRWQIEVTFRDIKQELGFGDARNGWWRRKQGQRADARRNRTGPRRNRGAQAALRTAPLAAITYALVVRWYLEHGNPQGDVCSARERAPWYRTKKHPSFADMLAALRRQFWLRHFRRMRLSGRIRQKLANLLYFAGAAA